MNKRGDIKRILFEIAYIAFGALIGLLVLTFVYSKTSDVGFEAKIYGKDIKTTIHQMENSESEKIIAYYNLPSKFEFNIENNNIYIKTKDLTVKEEFQRNPNSEIKFKREKEKIILEKNEKFS